MAVSSVHPFVNIMSPASAAISRQAPPNLRAPTDNTPQELGESGASQFSHRHLIEGMKDKLRAQVLTEKNIDPSTLDAMPSEQRASVEAQIGREVDQKLRETLDRVVEDGSRSGKTQGLLVDLSV